MASQFRRDPSATAITRKLYPGALPGEAGPPASNVGLNETVGRAAVTGPSRTGDYRKDIDGLRAVAVTSVVLFHAGLFPFSRSGYVGVDIFFVISGYLIGGIILRGARAGRFSYGEFYARRARRILPALIAVVLAACAAGWFLLGPAQFQALGTSAFSALLAVSNFSFWRFNDYFQTDSGRIPLLMTWSLGVEEQFYLFFPLIALAISRWSTRTISLVFIAVTLSSFLICVLASYYGPAAAFYLVPFRAWELGAGVLVAHMEAVGGRLRSRLLAQPAQDALGATGAAALVVAMVGFDDTVPFPGLAAAVPVLGTVCLLCAGSSRVNRKLLSLRPIVFIGLVSYSWYLWHWPLMSFVRNVAFIDPPLLVMLPVAALSFGIAVLSWRFIEQPFRRGPFRVRRTLLGYGGAVAVAASVALTIKAGAGFPHHLPPEASAIEAALRAGLQRPCLSAWGDDKPDPPPACARTLPGRPTVMLVGDSHAWALGDGLRAAAERQGWGYEILTKSACRPMLGVTVWRRAEPELAGACAAYMTAAFERAKADPDVRTVILAGLWPIPDAPSPAERFAPVVPYSGEGSTVELLHFGLKRAVAALVAAGKHVVVVGDVPRWRFDASQIALTRTIPGRAALAPWLWSRAPGGFPEQPGRDLLYQPDQRNIDLFRALGREESVTYVDLFPRFCPDERCFFERDGTLMYIDTGHLSAEGARFALQDLRLD